MLGAVRTLTDSFIVAESFLKTAPVEIFPAAKIDRKMKSIRNLSRFVVKLLVVGQSVVELFSY